MSLRVRRLRERDDLGFIGLICSRTKWATFRHRLEARGFVTRRRDPDDRRKVIVEATEEVRRLADIYYGPIQRQGRQMLEAFSDAELGTILEFLTSAADLQREQLSQLPLYRSSAGH